MRKKTTTNDTGTDALPAAVQEQVDRRAKLVADLASAKAACKEATDAVVVALAEGVGGRELEAQEAAQVKAERRVTNLKAAIAKVDHDVPRVRAAARRVLAQEFLAHAVPEAVQVITERIPHVQARNRELAAQLVVGLREEEAAFQHVGVMPEVMKLLRAMVPDLATPTLPPLPEREDALREPLAVGRSPHQRRAFHVAVRAGAGAVERRRACVSAVRAYADKHRRSLPADVLRMVALLDDPPEPSADRERREAQAERRTREEHEFAARVEGEVGRAAERRTL